MKPIKCIVPTCPNHSDAGEGKYLKIYPNNTKEVIEEEAAFICNPCWRTINGTGDKHSWLYKSCNGFKNAE